MTGSRRRALSGALLSVLLLDGGGMTAGAQENPSKIRIEGNLDIGGEWRRDADAEYQDRPDDSKDIIGFDRAVTRNTSRPHGDFALFAPTAEFRAYAFPTPAIEIYAKIFASGRDDDYVFVDESHAKVRLTRGQDQQERGLESYFFFRQGRLGVGDPILGLAFDDGRADNATSNNHSGVATTWWLERGRGTFPKGRWSGEFNIQNFPNQRPAAVIRTLAPNVFLTINSAEDNEGIAAKIRHDYQHNTDLNIAGELLWAHKSFTPNPWDIISNPTFTRHANDVFGADLQVAYKTTNLALQYHPASRGLDVGSRTPDNDAFGANINNLEFINRPWSGRLGMNATYIHWGRYYRNFIGREPEFMGFVSDISNGYQTDIGDQVAQDVSTEIFWDLPRYQATLVYRRQDKDGMRLRRRLSRRNELDLYLKLIHGIDARVLYSRTGFGYERILRDFDANRFLRYQNNREENIYLSLLLNRQRYSVKTDFRRYDQRGVVFHVAGLETNYKFTERLSFLLRGARVWINRPERNYHITKMPFDLGSRSDGDRIRTSIVDSFFSRFAGFAQLTYRPTDNAEFLIEYGKGYATDNDLSLDGDLLKATVRTDPRIYTKLALWF